MASTPAYMKIRRYVIDLARKHTMQDAPIMSERELCHKFGVTRPTARRALKGLIADGYLETRQGRGTFINPALATNYAFMLRESFTVALLIGGGGHVDMDGFFMAVLERVCSYLKSRPVQLRIQNLDAVDIRTADDELGLGSLDGILWVRPGDGRGDLIDALREKVPTYVIGDVPDGRSCHVTADYERGGTLAAAWFLKQGYRRVAFVGAADCMPIKKAVHRGWRAAFAAAGVSCPDTLSVGMDCDIPARMRSLLAENAFDGVFVFGSEFSAVDAAFAGVEPGVCPVLVDDNHYGTYGARIRPAAMLDLFPEDVPTLAAKQLFRSLRDASYHPAETVIPPTIRQGMRRRSIAAAGAMP